MIGVGGGGGAGRGTWIGSVAVGGPMRSCGLRLAMWDDMGKGVTKHGGCGGHIGSRWLGEKECVLFDVSSMYLISSSVDIPSR